MEDTGWEATQNCVTNVQRTVHSAYLITVWNCSDGMDAVGALSVVRRWTDVLACSAVSF